MGILNNLKNANKNARELEAEKAKNEQLKKNTAIVAGGGIAATAGVATYGFFKRRKYDKMFAEKEAKLENLENEKQNLEIELSDLNNQVVDLEESVNNDTETINSLSDQLKSTNTLLADTRKEMLNLQGTTPDAALLQRVTALETEKARLASELAQANNALAMASGNISQPATTPTPVPAQPQAPTAPAPVQQTAPVVNYVNDAGVGVVSTVSAPTSTPTAEPKGTAVPVIETTITTTEGTATTTAQGEIVLNNTAEQQCPVQPETPTVDTAATTTATTSITTSTTKTPTQVSQMPGKNGGKNKGKKR